MRFSAAASLHKHTVAFVRVLVVALGSLFCTSCGFGDGEGQLEGLVWAPICDWEAEPFELDPTFFGADRTEIVDAVIINILHGEGEVDEVDRWSISVANAADISGMLNVPIDLSTSEDVHMNIFFGKSCRGTDDPLPNYEAVSGTVVFSAFSVPWENGTGKYYEAELMNGVFVDHAEPVERRAELNGHFRFKFRRGNPAQPFP